MKGYRKPPLRLSRCSLRHPAHLGRWRNVEVFGTFLGDVEAGVERLGDARRIGSRGPIKTPCANIRDHDSSNLSRIRVLWSDDSKGRASQKVGADASGTENACTGRRDLSADVAKPRT